MWVVSNPTDVQDKMPSNSSTYITVLLMDYFTQA